MNIKHETDIVENVNSQGRRKFWQGRVYEQDGKIYTQKMHWQETTSGENSTIVYHDPVEIIVPKSKDTIEEQAVFDIESAKRKQIDKISQDEKPLPMLAHKFADNEAKFKFPCFIQPKYDGFRMLMDGEKAWTRKGKVWGEEKGMDARCIQHIMFDTHGYILDGELMLDRPYIRQQTASAAKSFDDEDMSAALKYFVYDIVEPDLPYQERLRILREEIMPNAPACYVLCPTHEVVSKQDADAKFEEYLALGEEGIMYRSIEGLYAINKRSRDLLKQKQFIECEFEVLDVIPQPKRPTEGMLVVDLGPSGTSTIMIEGGRHKCEEILTNRSEVIGQIWTVRFQEGLTKDGNLQFAKGVGQRDTDLDGEPDMFTSFNWRKQNGEKVKVDAKGIIKRSDDDDDTEPVQAIEAPKKSLLKNDTDKMMGEIEDVIISEKGFRLKIKVSQGDVIAVMTGPISQQKEIFEQKRDHIGKTIQVEFSGWNDDRTPKYPLVRVPFIEDVAETKTKPKRYATTKKEFTQITTDSLFGD